MFKLLKLIVNFVRFGDQSWMHFLNFNQTSSSTSKIINRRKRFQPIKWSGPKSCSEAAMDDEVNGMDSRLTSALAHVGGEEWRGVREQLERNELEVVSLPSFSI